MRQWTPLESVVCQCKPLNVRNVALRGRDYQHVDGVTRATGLGASIWWTGYWFNAL
jgi:hypothetical protein